MLFIACSRDRTAEAVEPVRLEMGKREWAGSPGGANPAGASWSAENYGVYWMLTLLSVGSGAPPVSVSTAFHWKYRAWTPRLVPLAGTSW